jgi:hypothetical protein
MAWLDSGMSVGAATALTITGPATKIVNLGAVKIVLGMKNFIVYLAFAMLFALLCGCIVDIAFLMHQSGKFSHRHNITRLFLQKNNTVLFGKASLSRGENQALQLSLYLCTF